MRIGYVYPFQCYPPHGGNQLHALHLIREFHRHGHQVVTLGDSSYPGLVTANGTAALLARVDVAYVRIDGYPLSSLPDSREILLNERVPVVVEINAPANEMLAFSWMGGRRTPASVVGRRIDSARRRFHAFRSMPAIRREERLRRAMATRWQAAVCVSSALGRYAREALRIRNVHVLPNASDPVVMRPDVVPQPTKARPGDMVVLYAGSPKYPWQGLDLLMAVARRAAAESLPLHFVVVANEAPEGPQPPPNMEVVVGVQYDEIASWICAADVCVSLHPDYPWSPWGFHNSPLKLFDYMACGRAVLASNIGQMAEVVSRQECGLLCDFSEEAVIAHLLLLAQDRSRRLIFGRNGREAVERQYNWEANGIATLAVLGEAVRSHDEERRPA
jgi:glycosyltransferase involved in cell wall biosynthesis